SQPQVFRKKRPSYKSKRICCLTLSAKLAPCWLRKKYLLRRSLTPAAKAGTENRRVIAALKRCAAQNQVQYRVFRNLLVNGRKGSVTEQRCIGRLAPVLMYCRNLFL